MINTMCIPALVPLLKDENSSKGYICLSLSFRFVKKIMPESQENINLKNEWKIDKNVWKNKQINEWKLNTNVLKTKQKQFIN